MAYISFGVGSRSDKSIQAFVSLCGERGIKTFFTGEKNLASSE